MDNYAAIFGIFMIPALFAAVVAGLIVPVPFWISAIEAVGVAGIATVVYAWRILS